MIVISVSFIRSVYQKDLGIHIEPRYLLSPEYLYFYTKSPVYEMWKNFIFTQATIQNIGADKYAYLPVIVPPISEQQRITDHLDQETQRLDQLKSNLNQQINVLSDYKKSLIYECVTGKKRVIKAG
ncbi:MAG: restriction endonuclease subunit S [Methylococcales bacterium]